MSVSEKQNLYLDILEMVLPYLRGVQTHGIFRRIRYGSFYTELELIHNLPPLLLYPEFQDRDVHWLNSQAKIFVDRGRKDFPFHQAICDDIKALFALLPQASRGKLIWNGP